MSIEVAAAALRRCFAQGGALLCCAGAGMGVDSGLPDFRGPQGFWRAYPAYEKLGLSFEQLADPSWFQRDSALAWGFYGHRFNLYRKTKPHDGYTVLRTLGERAPAGSFVFTSNVDGSFEAAGFASDRICEVHGAIQTFQCTKNDHGLWSAPAGEIDVCPQTFRARGALPTCPCCGALARPNILMFGDADWQEERCGVQTARLIAFIDTLERSCPLVIVEAGAGRAVPTVRRFSEQMLRTFAQARLVRINVREAAADDDIIKDRVIEISLGARAALAAVAALCQDTL